MQFVTLFMTWNSQSGALSVTPTDVLNAGTYSFKVTATLDLYPTTSSDSFFKVTIQGGIPESSDES